MQKPVSSQSHISYLVSRYLNSWAFPFDCAQGRLKAFFVVQFRISYLVVSISYVAYRVSLKNSRVDLCQN